MFFLRNKNYLDELTFLLIKEFVPVGYKITRKVELDPLPESAKYEALNFHLNDRRIVYRKGKITSDRPGAFLAVWQRPPLENLTSNKPKPIPLTSDDLDYLFIHVESHSNISEGLEHRSKYGMFIFPVSLLVEKGILASVKSKGKTGFRVFPRGAKIEGMLVLRYFLSQVRKPNAGKYHFF